EAVQKGKQYDLLLMDVEMPVMDGPQAVRQLRAIGCQTPIVALTAHTDPVCVQQFLQSGYTGLIPKPVDRDGLLEAVASILTPRGTKIPTLVQVNEQQWMDHMGASGLVLPVVNQ
ncbi:MAG TPA: response regulator, partial [Thermogutta sp.]|nr:response regulator [Thermogutta sp.]